MEISCLIKFIIDIDCIVYRDESIVRCTSTILF